MNPRSSDGASANILRCWRRVDTCADRPTWCDPESSLTSPNRARSRVVLPEPFSPVIMMRSPAVTATSTGPSVKSPSLTVAPVSVATSVPERSAVAKSSWSSHGSHGASTRSLRSSRSSARSVCFALPAIFSLVAIRWARMFLSGSDLSVLALRTPTVDHCCWVWARSCSCDRLALNSS